MKNIYSITAILFLVLLSVNMVSAEALQGFKTDIVLKQGSSIDMDFLEGLCSSNYCDIYDTEKVKQITFKIDYEEKEIIFTAKQDKENDFYSLTLYDKSQYVDFNEFKSTVSTGLRLLTSNDVVLGLSEEDINSIIDLVRSGVVIYYKENSCGDSYFKGFDEEGDVGQSGWLASIGDRCSFNGYKNGCSSLTCCGDSLRGQLIVGFKDGTSLTDAQDLVTSFGLDSEEKISSLWDVNEWLVVLVPDGEESSWKQTLESEDIIDYAELNGIGCTAGGGISIPDVTNLLSLPLEKNISGGENGKDSSNLTYWIIGIALVLVIVLFLVFRKKK